MKNGVDIEVESTPVIDLNRHGLVDAANSGDEDGVGLPGEWDNEKTEVYTDSEEEGNAQLVDSDGEIHTITAFPFVLGRGNECDFVLTGKGVSRKHAEIIFQSGRFVVNDLNSLNGIKVNGYKVSRVILEEGDVIKLGDVTLAFSQGGDSKVATKKPKRSSIFNKPAPQEVASEDDTFGQSPVKKVAKGVVMMAAAGIVLAVGWMGYQQFTYSQKTSQQIVAVSPQSQQGQTSKLASEPAANLDQANESQGADDSVAAEVSSKASGSSPSVGAPPPSIAMAPVSQSREYETKSASESAGSAIKTAAAEPKTSPNPAVNDVQQAAAKLLSSANSEFLGGSAPTLFTNMTKFENNSRVYAGTKAKLKNKHEQLARLYALYEKGQKAFVSGDKQGAFVAWSSFLEKETQVFGKQKSVYADQVTARVVDEYVERGNAAAKEGKHHEAYRLWQKALDVGESVAAKIAIDNANTKSRQLYRKALRLEYVNSSKAKELWTEVVNLVPAGTEYHTKASSKLAWYERWGA